MPIEPLLGEFTVFERFHDGFIESQRHGGRVTIMPREGEDAGYQVCAQPDVVFRFDPMSGTLEPGPGQNSAVREIAYRKVGRSRPPVPHFVPTEVHPQHVVVLIKPDKTLYLVRGAGPGYWADVPHYLPPGVETVEAWGENTWAYTVTIKRQGSRSELEVGELVYDGERVAGRLGQIIYTPIGKFRSNGDFPRQFGSQGWFPVNQ